MKLVVSLVLPQVAGLSGAVFTETGEGSWYRNIERPSWNPPSWLFAPVWTTLYILMGIAFYLIWKTPASSQRNQAMGLWVAQLILNFFWTIVFFKLTGLLHRKTQVDELINPGLYIQVAFAF